MGIRKEHDSLGEVSVDESVYWGAQTQRSLKYFSIGKEGMPLELIHVYGLLKQAAAETNCELGLLSKEERDVIVRASLEVAEGALDAHFPLHVWMTGSGTQTNMNVNEVIANRAIELLGGQVGSRSPIHPNDHVNCSQSTNDTFPTVMHIATACKIERELFPALESLHRGLLEKADSWEKIIKVGRTHLQDATPISLGQEFSGYASMIEANIKRLRFALQDVYSLPLGGTAVGTGLNAPADFGKAAVAKIAELTSLPFCPANNRFALQGSHDALVMLSATMKTLACSLYKITQDIRLLGSGPRCGMHELEIPANEPGSSMMPGKVNPTQCEALAMIAYQVMANDVAVTLGGSGGDLEMNVYKPLIIYNILQSIQLIADGCSHFGQHLLQGLKPNDTKLQQHVANSLMLVTALTPVIGYDKAATVAHYAHEHGMALKAACVALSIMTEAEFDARVKIDEMV